jgi:hypothetical protein
LSSNRKARHKVFTSLEEDSNRFANGKKLIDKIQSPDRGINKMHFDALNPKQKARNFGKCLIIL